MTQFEIDFTGTHSFAARWAASANEETFMHLFLLDRNAGDREWDTLRRCVVRAIGEHHARQVAHDDSGGDENKSEWLDHEKTTCVVLGSSAENGPPAILISDFLHG